MDNTVNRKEFLDKLFGLLRRDLEKSLPSENEEFLMLLMARDYINVNLSHIITVNKDEGGNEKK